MLFKHTLDGQNINIDLDTSNSGKSKSTNMASNNTEEVKFRFQIELRGPLGAKCPGSHYSLYSVKHGRNVFNERVEVVPGLRFMVKLALGHIKQGKS